MFIQFPFDNPVRTSSSADFSERFARDLRVDWTLWGLGNQQKTICGIV